MTDVVQFALLALALLISAVQGLVLARVLRRKRPISTIVVHTAEVVDGASIERELARFWRTRGGV